MIPQRVQILWSFELLFLPKTKLGHHLVSDPVQVTPCAGAFGLAYSPAPGILQCDWLASVRLDDKLTHLSVLSQHLPSVAIAEELKIRVFLFLFFGR